MGVVGEFQAWQQFRYFLRDFFLPATLGLEARFFGVFARSDFFFGDGFALARRVVFFDFWDGFLADLANAGRDFFFVTGLRGP